MSGVHGSGGVKRTVCGKKINQSMHLLHEHDEDTGRDPEELVLPVS